MMIEVTNLTKTYKDLTVVDGISFQVKEGETLGIIGTSGCGKTTTLKMLNRLIEPSSGQVLIGGEDIRTRRPEKLRQSMGYVIQNTGLFPHFTVAENIAVVPRLLRWQEQQIRTRIWELLNLVGLPADKFAKRYPHELSGGQQQRIGLARALAANPPIILLDEPFGALDQITRSQIQSEFKQLESLLNKTVVIVTHDVFEAATLCNKICLMDRGIIQQLGSPQELIFQPKNQFVRDFFNEYRFQLELKITTLKDLYPWLPPSSFIDKSLPTYPENTGLLDILEQVQVSLSAFHLDIKNSQGETVLQTTGENLLSAFYQMKESLNSKQDK